MNLNVQFATMAAMIAGGASLGLLFDAYRVLSWEFRFPRWMIPPLDLLYWAFATVAVFRALYAHNGGEVRMYVFLALGIGICFYFGLLSGWIVRMFRWTIGRLRQLVRLLLRLGDLLVVRPAVWLYRGGIVFFGFLAALTMFLFKLVLQLLYPLWKFALWLARPLALRASDFLRANRWLAPRAGRLFRRIRKLWNRK